MAAGVLVALATMALTVRVGERFYPQSVPIDWIEQVVVEEWLAPVPRAAKLLLLAGWFTSALAGSGLTGLLTRRSGIGWVPVGIVLLHALGSVGFGPTPRWLATAAVLSVLASGWIGVRLTRSML